MSINHKLSKDIVKKIEYGHQVSRECAFDEGELANNTLIESTMEVINRAIPLGYDLSPEVMEKIKNRKIEKKRLLGIKASAYKYIYQNS